MSFRDVEDTMRQFTGDGKCSIESWIADFEEHSTLLGWDPIQKLIFGKKLLSGLAKLFVQGERGLVTWEKLKSALLKEFTVKVNSAELHGILSKRKMKVGESVQEYYLVLKELASRGNIDDEALMQYVINGIQGESTSKAVLYGATSLAEFRKKLQVFSAISNSQSQTRNDVQKKPIDGKTDAKTVGTRVKCFNCAKQGHYASECRSPKREKGSCFQCGSMNHQKKDCPQRSRVGDTATRKPESTQATHLIQRRELMPCYEVSVKFLYFNNKINGVVDSGSPISLLSEVALPTSMPMEPYTCTDQFKGVNDSQIKILGQSKQKIQVNGCTIDLIFYVVPCTTMTCMCLLGRDFIGHDDVEITFDKRQVAVKCRKQITNTAMNEILKIDLFDNQESKLDLEINPELDFDAKRKVNEIVNDHYVNAEKPIEPITNLEMELHFKPNHQPFYHNPRRLSYEEKIALTKIINDLLDRQIIRPSYSQYCSPVVMVKKKSGEYRMAIDYRELNKITLRDHFPIPRIDEQIDDLGNKAYFSRLDLKDAFYHVKLKENSIPFTSFITYMGHYEFVKMPFGLSIILHAIYSISLSEFARKE